MTEASPITPLLVRAARGERVDRVPIWLMRQAGRYLEEYRRIREKHGFLDVVKNPELAAEVSLQPYRLFAPDGVIMFSDILTPLEGMGIPFALDEGGPRILAPIQTMADMEQVRVADPAEATPYVLELLRHLRTEIAAETAVLGFAGAPYTLAFYAVGHRGKRKESAIKALAYQEPALVHALLTKLADQTASYLAAQVDAGADAVQLFDTWAGELCEEDYRTFALPYQQRAIASVRGRVPVIMYALGVSDVARLAESGADVVSLDWRVDLAQARVRLGESVTLQGNLDPSILFGPPELIRGRATKILEQSGGRGHVFNLGHGLQPTTPRDSVALLFEHVHEWPGTSAR